MHVYIFLYAIIAFEAVNTQFAGESCTMLSNGAGGMCKKIIECPAAIDSLRRGKLPQTCGFEGSTPIVCCEGAVSIVVKSKRGVKSRQKCKEYLKFAYTTFVSPGLSVAPKNITYLECPFDYVPLIVGGTKAKPKEFPHSAAIGYSSSEGRKYDCGGSLISENFVLSAGHCYASRMYGVAKFVRVGDLNLVTSTDDAQPQEYDIAEFIRHPDYRPPAKYNDILLIRLTENVKFNHYVRPICLFTADQAPVGSAVATGWGTTEDSIQSDDLLKVTVNFTTNQRCSEFYQPNKRLYKDGIREESQLCAGNENEVKDTCQGDSGGPLQIYNTEVECSYWLVGVTSFGRFCGIGKSPGIYTKVSHYVDWIENTVWP